MSIIMTATVVQARSTECNPIQLETTAKPHVSTEEELMYRDVFGDMVSETQPKYEHLTTQEPLDPHARVIPMRSEGKLFYSDVM